jgi:glyoxylase-like metal-dependent hydrolase (beta-lactamase superfamily II)
MRKPTTVRCTTVEPGTGGYYVPVPPRVDLVSTVTSHDYPSVGLVDVQNNVWIVGGDAEVVVIDASHDPVPIVEAIGGRRVVAIAHTHGHWDHIDVAFDLQENVDAPILMHPADRPVWQRTYPDREPDGPLAEGALIVADGVELRILHTPGHTPGSVSFHHTASAALFDGDTLFPGGPGSTGDELGDFDVIIASIRDRILTMASETTLHPGHGDPTTVGAEAPHLQEWIDRGW